MWFLRFLAAVFNPCTYGLHRWSMPAGWCEGCGACDDFFGGHEECGETCKWFVPPDADTHDTQTGQGRR